MPVVIPKLNGQYKLLKKGSIAEVILFLRKDNSAIAFSFG
jgi:hypothetical protein